MVVKLPGDKTKMRFCLVTTFYPPYHPGGCGLHVYHLANLLAADGHSVDVVCSAGAHRLKLSSPRPGSYPAPPGVRVIRVPGGKFEALATYLAGRGLSSHRRLRRILGESYDVVHFHNISLLGGIKLLREGSGIKLFTQHTYWLLCPLHYLWKFDREPCADKNCLACLLRAGKPPVPWRWFEGWQADLAGIDSLIMPCRDMIERHRREGITGRMDHLPYFVDAVKAAPRPGGETGMGERPFFLLVTRLESYKGPRLALEAFLSSGAASSAELIIVGTGSLAAALRERAAGHPRVRFLDYVAPEDLDWYYAHARALLAPAVWPEMGNQTVLSSLSCGTPVIASNRGCLPELVGENQAGLLVEGEQDMAAALETMMAGGEAYEAFQACARRAWREHYSPELFRERYLGILTELGIAAGA